MKRILVKIIIAVAIGLIVGEIVGMTTKYKVYYSYNGDKREVTRRQYLDEFESRRATEYKFNRSNSIFYGSITTSVCLLLLLFPELRKDPKKE